MISGLRFETKAFIRNIPLISAVFAHFNQ